MANADAPKSIKTDIFLLIFWANDMGKKGGKKEHNVDKAAENAEPNLSTIPEETNLEQEKPGDTHNQLKFVFLKESFPQKSWSNQLKEQKCLQ